MTQEERIEILRRVAEVAPKEMKARLQYGVFMDCKVAIGGHTLFLHPEFNDDQAVFAMLGAIRQRVNELLAQVGKTEDWEEVAEYGRIRDILNNASNAELHCPHPWLSLTSERVARAFVEVFGERQGGGEMSRLISVLCGHPEGRDGARHLEMTYG